MKALSGEHVDEYYNVVYEKIESLMIRDTWDIFSKKSVDNNNVLPGTWYFNYKRKPD